MHTLEEVRQILEAERLGMACLGGNQGVGNQEEVRLACQEGGHQMASAVFPVLGRLK